MNIRTASTFSRRVLRFAGRRLFHAAENDDDPRMEKNGERWFVRSLLAQHRARARKNFVLFDAGTNMGEYSEFVLVEGQAAGLVVEVHGFEPSNVCLDSLRKRFEGNPKFRVTGAAVSDRAGEGTLHDGNTGSGHASLVKRDMVSRDKPSLTVPLLRLDDYIAERAVSRIDLLKLDVEGSELSALRGAGDRLQPGVIDVIQFEYGGAALDARTTLKDVYDLLTARGYVIAKLFPNALEVRSYKYWMEHYAYANYVALSPRWLSRSADSQ